MDDPTGSDARKDRIAMRSLTLGALASIAAVAGGCASGVGSQPPGGREDHTPPVVVAVIPDTGTTNFKGKDLVVQYNEVVSERPSQGGSLADEVLISPRGGDVDVSWHRKNLSIRPSKGWRKNTAYTVTILPGIADLRNNVSKVRTQVLFSTGPTIPGTNISGRVFDWVGGTPLRGAVVEAVTRTDTSLVYVTTADSTGAFTLRGMQPGVYMVRGYSDENKNNGFDPREPFDSTTFTLADSARLELLAFVHDSAGPRIGTVVARDSVTLRVSFDTPIDPTWAVVPTAFQVVNADTASITLPVTAAKVETPDTTHTVSTQPNYPATSRSRRAARAARDSALADTIPIPRPSRALLFRDLIITLGAPLTPRGKYILRSTNVRGPGGATLSSELQFSVPAAFPKVDTTATRPVNAPPQSPPPRRTSGMRLPRSR